MAGDSSPSPRSTWAPVLAVLAAATLFGTTGTALSRGPETTDPWAAASLRLCIGGALLALVARRHMVGLRSHRRWALTGAVGTDSDSTGSEVNERFCRTTRWIGCTGFMVITAGLNEIRMARILIDTR